MRYEIVPTIIATNDKELNEKITICEDMVEKMQLDVVDGKFAPNRSFMFNFKPKKTELKFEAHLMVESPGIWVLNHHDHFVEIITHVEGIHDNINDYIQFIIGKKKKVGLAITYKTPVKWVLPYLNSIDKILVLTVKPGFYGSPFIANQLEKVKVIRKLFPEIDIEVDGHMNDKTIPLAKKAGANIFCVGSYIFGAKDPKKRILKLKKLIEL